MATFNHKQAQQVVKKFFGSKGVAVAVTREAEPFRLGIQGDFAVDVKARGNSWDEAVRKLQEQQARELEAWKVQRRRRIERAKVKAVAASVGVQIETV